jgi:hypothetical protein
VVDLRSLVALRHPQRDADEVPWLLRTLKSDF